jgi:hypothetical protein
VGSAAQDCSSILMRSKDDKFSVFLSKLLTGKVQDNPTDTLHGMICKPSYFKTPSSSGINLNFTFIRCGKMLDASVKVKVEFVDGTYIFLSRSEFDSDNPGAMGIFSFLSGGNYGHSNELKMLRTKQISKICISGNQIDSYTYTIDSTDSLYFMSGMDCLFKLAK